MAPREIFAHRLWAIGKEGRLALQRVTASPIVAQAGECMSSFYAADGTMILVCSGHLRFAAATSDAIKKLVEWFGRSPGIFDGDELLECLGTRSTLAAWHSPSRRSPWLCRSRTGTRSTTPP